MSMEVGDYDLRGPDFETLLVGPITAKIIDADRIVRAGPDGWHNGFPNWAMYRCAFAGDTHLSERLRQWCVAFAVAYCADGAVRRQTASDELAAYAGWDAYSALTHHRWAANSDSFAEAAGVAPKTYRKLRNAVYARLKVSLSEYWVRMQIGMRQASLTDRYIAEPIAMSRLADGRGFEHDLPSHDGNYRAYPKKAQS